MSVLAFAFGLFCLMALLSAVQYITDAVKEIAIAKAKEKK